MRESCEPWPHAPPHWNHEPGIYFVTGATLHKEHHFRSEDRVQFLHDLLLKTLKECLWDLKAWAVFSNHYHFIATSCQASRDLSKTVGQVRGLSSQHVNRLDNSQGRKVWHNYRETQLTFQRSYLARMHYVIHNPVHHGLVVKADGYPWCSARWFAQVASQSFQKTVLSFPIDRLDIADDF